MMRPVRYVILSALAVTLLAAILVGSGRSQKTPRYWDMPPDSIVDYQPTPLPEASPLPSYPDSARMAGISGQVDYLVYVNRRGLPRKWRLVKETPPGWGFAAAVESALPLWRFIPGTQLENPVGMWQLLTFPFPPQPVNYERRPVEYPMDLVTPDEDL